MKKRALISVSDKNGIVEFAIFLEKQGYEIISTGGTFNHLKNKGVSVFPIQEATHFPEILDGRVKTLHPNIHAGILAKRSNTNHMETMREHSLSTIDIVVVNLYPFFEHANKNIALDQLIEFIDIGGPTMLRAAAKSFQDVTVISNPSDMSHVKSQIEELGNTSLDLRKTLAAKVFQLTSAYDGAIALSLSREPFPEYFPQSYTKSMNLRYGENPHQKAAFYSSSIGSGTMKNITQHQGKELSFNNIRDLDVACRIVSDFDQIACCAVKHSTPCGFAIGQSIEIAFEKTFDCDPISIFGGIVAFNRTVTKKIAKRLNELFLEIVVAPGFELEVLDIFKKKKNLRVITAQNKPQSNLQTVHVDGGILVQEIDHSFSNNIKTVTNHHPTEQQKKDLLFAQKIVKHVKSNAIVVAANGQALGIGTGEVNRIWAAKQAIERAKEKKVKGLVLASDAFFPFRDVVDISAKEGIEAIIQPGGSIKDQESINAANEYGIPMLMTGMRHFLH